MTDPALLDRIAAVAARMQPRLVEIRRDIHRHPELGFQEVRTARLIAQTLKDLGLEVEEEVAVTGVVGVLRGGKPGPTFAIRADMDALPMPEKTGLPFASECDNVMHACGHDCHVTMALGAAMCLSAVADQLPGVVKFFFQPGEEGMAGGKSMVEQGVLEQEPRVDAIMALHMAPAAPTGLVLTRPGPIMAAGDMFSVEIEGRGGHAARPQDCIDPILVASHVIQALQTIVSRTTDPADNVVISVTKIAAGTTYNVIPDTCTLLGTVRTLREKVRADVEAQMERLVERVCASFGATGTLYYAHGYGVTANDARMQAYLKQVVADVFGPERYYEMATPMMGAEDFSYFLNAVPGVFAFLGAAENPKTAHPIHSSHMVVDEAVLEIGARLAASTAARFLHEQPLHSGG